MRRIPLFIGCVAIAATSACSASASRRAREADASTSVPTQPPQKPVVLLHGTFGATSWGAIEGALSAGGYSVYPFTYGNGGTDEIARSAGALAGFVDNLLARTGAKRLSLIGHSQGGLVARYYVRFLGGSQRVDDIVGLSPPNHGTANLMAGQAGLSGCEACAEQVAGSPFLAYLNTDEEAPPPVDYTMIQTRFDLVVIPYTSAFLAGPADRVTNVTLQERCAGDFVGHVNIPSDPVAVQWVENALDRAGPADPESSVPRC